MDVRWVLVKSWHAIRRDRRSGGWITYCGRRVDSGETRDTLPAAKSCESCLRIIGRSADQ
jgi:hypothetical protein